MRLPSAGLERGVKWSTFNMLFLFLLLSGSQASFAMDEDLEAFQMSGNETRQRVEHLAISESGSSESKAKRGRLAAAAKEVGVTVKKEGVGAAKCGPLKKDNLEGTAWCTFHEKYEDVALFSGKKASRCTPVRLAIEPGP